MDNPILRGVAWSLHPVLWTIFVATACSPTIQTKTAGSGTKTSEGTNPMPPEKSTHVIPGTDITFEMSLLPAGEYSMGSPENEVGRESDEGPQVPVRLESFWIGIHEVSYDEYQVFREKDLDKAPAGQEESWNADAVSRPSPPYEDPTFGMGSRGYPAVSMTQFAALQYCKWLSKKTGRFYRLPTEAEWEYACRAGSTTAYHFGEDPSAAGDFAWHQENSDQKYHPVGSKKPNPWGLYDMHGNVSEWTLDQYADDFYEKLHGQSEIPPNPWAEPSRLHPRTVRGGSWDDPVDQARCASRIKSSPKWKERDPQIPKSFWWNTDSPFVGFRIVSPYNQPTQEERDAFWSLVLGG